MLIIKFSSKVLLHRIIKSKEYEINHVNSEWIMNTF